MPIHKHSNSSLVLIRLEFGVADFCEENNIRKSFCLLLYEACLDYLKALASSENMKAAEAKIPNQHLERFEVTKLTEAANAARKSSGRGVGSGRDVSAQESSITQKITELEAREKVVLTRIIDEIAMDRRNRSSNRTTVESEGSVGSGGPEQYCMIHSFSIARQDGNDRATVVLESLLLKIVESNLQLNKLFILNYGQVCHILHTLSPLYTLYTPLFHVLMNRNYPLPSLPTLNSTSCP